MLERETDMEKFLQFVAEIMGVDAAELDENTAYKEYEAWDSLMMLTLVMELEAEYGVSIPMEKLGDVKTLADLYQLVQ